MDPTKEQLRLAAEGMDELKVLVWKLSNSIQYTARMVGFADTAEGEGIRHRACDFRNAINALSQHIRRAAESK
jgi:hypothetical protein